MDDIRRRRSPLLGLAVLGVLLSPGFVQAQDEDGDGEAETALPRPVQFDEGLVRITPQGKANVSTRFNSGYGRPAFQQTVRLSLLVDNTLEHPIKALELELIVRDHSPPLDLGKFPTLSGLEQPRDPDDYARFQVAQEIAAKQKVTVPAAAVPDSFVQGTDYTVGLVKYQVVGPGGDVLLKLSTSGGIADMAAAALALQHHSIPRKARAEAARLFTEAVRAGPSSEAEPSLAPLYAIRALGQTGDEAAVPLLLELPLRQKEYEPSLLMLELVQKVLPDHPLVQLLPTAELREIARAALHDLPAEGAVPGLVLVAYGSKDAVLRKQARALLDLDWPDRSQRTAALRAGASRATAEALCGHKEADAVQMLMAIAAAGRDDGQAQECISTLPDQIVVDGLLRALEEPPGLAEAPLRELLLSRGPVAHAGLLRVAKEKGWTVPPEAELPALLEAFMSSARTEWDAALLRRVAAAAHVEPYSLNGVRGALYRLWEAEALCVEDRQRAEVAKGYAQVAVQMVRYAEPAMLNETLERLSVLLGPRPAHDTADAALLALAQDVSRTQNPLDTLDRIGPLMVNKSGIIALYVQLADRVSDDDARVEIARRALKVDPGAEAAQAIVHEHNLQRRLGMFAVLVALVGVVAVIWFMGSHNSR